jgi:hypothetical protein
VPLSPAAAAVILALSIVLAREDGGDHRDVPPQAAGLGQARGLPSRQRRSNLFGQ